MTVEQVRNEQEDPEHCQVQYRIALDRETKQGRPPLFPAQEQANGPAEPVLYSHVP